MGKLKKIFIVMISILTVAFPTAVIADDNSIDMSSPIRVRVLEYKNNNLFTVQYEEKTFDVSMIGVDVVNSYVTTKYRQEDGEVIEYNVENKEQDIYVDLLRNNTLLLELDSKNNKYNKDGIIQAWFWVNGELFQGKLISEGRAVLDEELCNYSSCKKYYDVLVAEQELAKKSLVGVWGAKEINLEKNVGGAKNGMQIDIDMELLAYVMIGVSALLMITLIIVIISNKKHKKANKVEKIKKADKKLSKKEEKSTLVNEVRNIEIEKPVQEEVKPVIEKKEEEIKVEEPIKDIKRPEQAVEQVVEQTEKVQVEQVEKIEQKVQSTQAVVSEEKRTPEEEVAAIQAELAQMAKTNTENSAVIINEDAKLVETKEAKPDNILLRVTGTMFDTSDEKSKENPEIINIEYSIMNDDLSSSRKNIFVKPVKNTKLSDLCLEKTGYKQYDIDSGLFLEDAIKEFIEDARKVNNIYVWGTSSIDLIKNDVKDKMIPQDIEDLEKLLDEKVVNYKNDFAVRQEIKPCGLSKAIEMFNLPKSDSQLDMMESIYKAER